MGKKQDMSYPFWSRIVLVPDINQAQIFRKQHDLDYHQVFTFGEWMNARRGHLPVEIAIDNADMVLSQMLHCKVHLISVTEEPSDGQ
jgi:hypothetical protein